MYDIPPSDTPTSRDRSSLPLLIANIPPPSPSKVKLPNPLPFTITSKTSSVLPDEALGSAIAVLLVTKKRVPSLRLPQSAIVTSSSEVVV